MPIIAIELNLRKTKNQKKRKALNLIFNDLENLENGFSIKENLINMLDNAISSFIEIPKKDCDLADIRDDLKNIIWIKNLIKMC